MLHIPSRPFVAAESPQFGQWRWRARFVLNPTQQDTNGFDATAPIRQGLDNRLMDRFGWGLTGQHQHLDQRTGTVRLPVPVDQYRPQPIILPGPATGLPGLM